MVNDHTRSAENWKCVWYLLRLYIYIRVYVDSHSLGQLALASKRTASLYKYVDDSTIFEVCERDGVSLMQEAVDIASKWTEENYMKLNNEKSKEMIISFAKNGNFRHTIPNIKIDGIDVEQVDHAKLSQSDLVTVYLSVVRPVLEYACPVWHTNLQQYLSDNIETIQKRALRCIFRGASYAEILSNVGLQTLKDRCECICKKYFNSMKSQTHKLHHLLAR